MGPDWDDIRYFMAVLRSGSTLAAAKALRVDQTTVARRIQSLEGALGMSLFDKSRIGYSPTAASQALVEAAAAAENAMAGFESLAGQLRREVSGTVRLTTSQIMSDYLLSPALGKFHERHPALRLEVVTDDRFLDLSRGEADIALRVLILSKSQPGLVGRRLCCDRWSVYCSRAYAAAHGIPRSVAELRSHTLVMSEPGRYRVPIAEWFYNHVSSSEVAQFRNNIAGMFSDIKAGHGVSVMSDLMAACDADFVRCFTPKVEQPHELWLLTHERLRNMPRVRTVFDFLVAHFAKHPAVRQFD